jgi:DNA-binding MarR family transcriptional regulator
MTELSPDPKADRLLQLSEEVSRIAGSLAQISIGLSEPLKPRESSKGSNHLDVSKDVVCWLIRARRDRARYLCQDLFSEPAWDILLDLLRAELAQERVSVSSLCIASGVPATTALRCLKILTDQGLAVRRADLHDGRRVFVELAPEVSKSLRRYFIEVVQAGRPHQALPTEG